MELLATLTDEARRRRAEADATDKGYTIVGFSVGNLGHDPFDPTTELTPDVTLTACPEPTLFGPKALAGFFAANDSCMIYECVLERGEGVGLISNLCLIAEITSSPIVDDPELGSTFLFALVNFAQRPKLDLERLVLNVGVAR